MAGPHAIDASTRIVQADQLLSCEVEGEVVLLSIHDGMYYTLDAIGSQVWRTLREPCCIADIYPVLVQRYKVDPRQCEEEVLAFVRELAAAKLVKILDQGSDFSR